MPVRASRATIENVIGHLSQAWIERIAEPIADEVQAQHCQEDGEAGKELDCKYRGD
jgi:hypothetical protein